MKSDWLIFLGLIVVVAIVMAIVGFIGNKAVDGATNKMRAKRVQQQRQQPLTQQPQSLAARYQQPQTRQSMTPAAQPVSASPAQPAETTGFCMHCGQRLPAGASFCVHCGTKKGEV